MAIWEEIFFIDDPDGHRGNYTAYYGRAGRYYRQHNYYNDNGCRVFGRKVRISNTEFEKAKSEADFSIGKAGN